MKPYLDAEEMAFLHSVAVKPRDCKRCGVTHHYTKNKQGLCYFCTMELKAAQRNAAW